jgi:hypothetical protein
MGELSSLIGGEHRPDLVNRALRAAAKSSGATAFGAHQITCSDESELVGAESFQREFVRELLPPLRHADRAPFRTANFGGRHEWGGLALAENHFATHASGRPGCFKFMAIKVSSHVAFTSAGGKVTFGALKRYGEASCTCGALDAMLRGVRLPAIDELREAYHFEGLDRIALLNDARLIDPAQRLLIAALVQARLQARRVALEIQEHTPLTPTVYAVLPCVTLNRPDRDTEIVVGLYSADARGPVRTVTYEGLGDNPESLRVTFAHGVHRVEDAEGMGRRDARDHRAVIGAQIGDDHRRLSRRVAGAEKLDEIRKGVAKRKALEPEVARALLATLTLLLAEINPVLAALVVFAAGGAAIHHTARAHALAQRRSDEEEAREILLEFHARIEHLPPEVAQGVVEALLEEFGEAP